MGLIDYALNLQNRRDEGRAKLIDRLIQERQDAADQRQAVGLAQALAGVGKGPQAPVQQPDGRFKTPMDPDAAAAVRLMQNPGSRGIGNQLATNVMDPAWQQQQQNAVDQGYATRQQVDMAASEEARRNQLFPGQLKAQDYAANQDRRLGAALGIQQQQLDMEREKVAAAARAPLPLAQVYEQVNGGPLPSGMRAQLRLTPDGQQFVDAQPIEGTPEYRDSVNVTRQAEEGVSLIESFRDDLAQYGTEMGGGNARVMRQKRDRLISNYGFVMQKLGILQPGDLQRLDGVLPDPTAFGNQFNPAAAQSIDRVYEQFADQWEREVLKPAREVSWWVTPQDVTALEQADKARQKK